MGLAGGAIAAVQGDEVLNVGGDQCPSLGRRACENLVVGEPYQGWIGINRDDVVALGAQLLGMSSANISSSNSCWLMGYPLCVRSGRLDACLAACLAACLVG